MEREKITLKDRGLPSSPSAHHPDMWIVSDLCRNLIIKWNQTILICEDVKKIKCEISEFARWLSSLISAVAFIIVASKISHPTKFESIVNAWWISSKNGFHGFSEWRHECSILSYNPFSAHSARGNAIIVILKKMSQTTKFDQAKEPKGPHKWNPNYDDVKSEIEIRPDRSWW